MSRYTLLVDFIDGVTADNVAVQLDRIFATLDPAVRRTLTWDQDYELSAHDDRASKSARGPVGHRQPPESALLR